MLEADAESHYAIDRVVGYCEKYNNDGCRRKSRCMGGLYRGRVGQNGPLERLRTFTDLGGISLLFLPYGNNLHVGCASGFNDFC